MSREKPKTRKILSFHSFGSGSLTASLSHSVECVEFSPHLTHTHTSGRAGAHAAQVRLLDRNAFAAGAGPEMWTKSHGYTDTHRIQQEEEEEEDSPLREREIEGGGGSICRTSLGFRDVAMRMPFSFLSFWSFSSVCGVGIFVVNPPRTSLLHPSLSLVLNVNLLVPPAQRVTGD